MKLHLIVMLLATLNLSSARADGGVSDGGGGTTNPNPVPIQKIERVLRDFAPLLLNAVRAMDDNLQNLEPDLRPSFWQKLFGGPKTLHTLLRETQIELRYSAPCLDRNGNPQDGSIYASIPNAICLSAQRMAPKLNQWNVTAETLALHAHEVAHLLGADEKEARDLQMRIVDFIMREDAIDHIIELDSLLGTNKPLGMARWSLHTLLHSPHQETLLETIVGHVSHSLEQLDKSIGQYRKVPLTSDHFVHGVIRANYLMLYALQSACALRSGGETQMTCQIWIDHYFSNDASVSLGTLIERISDVPRKFPHAMDTIMVHYPKGTQDITKSLGGLLTFLDEMERSIESTSQFKLVIETIQ